MLRKYRYTGPERRKVNKPVAVDRRKIQRDEIVRAIIEDMRDRDRGKSRSVDSNFA